jgi:hypothetical protein
MGIHLQAHLKSSDHGAARTIFKYASSPKSELLTIGELARRTGVTTRQMRAR